MDHEKNQLLFLMQAATSIIVVQKLRSKKKRKRRLLSEYWRLHRDKGAGVLNMLDNELRVEDPVLYKNFLLMCHPYFEELLNLIRNDIMKMDPNMRQSISPERRLAVTLRYLTTGETYKSLMYSTRIHESTISFIVPHVCKCIYANLKDLYLKMPTSVDDWLKIASDFEHLWNFPMCLGSMDGKHINFKAPQSAGSFNYNYKGYLSVVLIAMCDANYKFTYIDVGDNGGNSDGGVFRECSLKRALDLDLLSLPPDKVLMEQHTPVPYLIVADDAFPISRRITKPYPNRGLTAQKRIFNHRLSRARRVIENTFGILTNRFRVLLDTINLSPDKVEDLVLACCVLHNYLATKNHAQYANIEQINGTSLPGLQQQGGNRPTLEALAIRNKFTEYFVTVGENN